MSAQTQEFDFSVDLLRALLWRHDDAANLQSILTQKNAWYLQNQTEFWDNWITDVFDLRTANDFGCSVWAIILGVPMNLIVPPNQGPQFGYGVLAYTTPYNIAPTSDQPVTSAALSSLRRQDWQGDRALSASARTNLLTQSQTFENAAWTKNAVSINTAATSAPDGTPTGEKLIDSTTTTTNHFCQSANVSSANAATTNSFSIFVKPAERPYVLLRLVSNANNANYCYGTFDLRAGAFTAGNNGAASGATVTATPLANGSGWWRLTLSGICGSGTGVFGLIAATATPGALSSSYAGVVGQGVYVWGAQLEAGSPTPYIATTSAAVTVTDYTLSTAGALTFAAAPGVPAQDNIYGTGSYTSASGTAVTFTNRRIATTWTNNNRYNFDNGDFGVSSAGVNLNISQKRILLQLAYYKLISRCTVPEINARLSAILGEYGNVYVFDSNNMQYITYVFGFTPDSALQFILENFDVLPRPAAVGIRYIVSTRPAFGFGAFNQNFNNGTFWSNN